MKKPLSESSSDELCGGNCEIPNATENLSIKPVSVLNDHVRADDTLHGGYRNIAVVGQFTENRLVTEITVEHEKSLAMFDSGSQSNLIPLELLTSQGIFWQPETDIRIVGFGSGEPVQVLGNRVTYHLL